jgi:outer membrane protein OmpA-like peptidoglycan-associated protein
MIVNKFKRPLLIVLISSMTFQVAAPAMGQTQTNQTDPCANNNGQVAGAVVGALLGGFLGSKVGKGNGRKVATVVGALGGLALGNYIGSELDRRKCEVSKIAQKNNLTISMTDISLPADQDGPPSGERRPRAADPVGMSISIQDRADGEAAADSPGGETLGNAALSTQFRSGSDVLLPEAEGYFHEIATKYALAFDSNVPQDASPEQVRAVQGLRQKRILIVGHTDDTGSSRLNADLSEQRARKVARLFAEAGVPASQLFYQGSGETQPIADNRSDSGRARNRRVEIVDLADEQAFQKYLASRVANTGFYRIAATPAAGADEDTEKSARPAAAAAAPAASKAARPAQESPRASRPALAARSASAAPVTSKPVFPQPAAAARQPVLAAANSGYDFGGMPAARKQVAIDIGRPLAQKSGFSFISTAMADDMPMARACTDDRPRYANAIKDLQGNREYHVSQYLPGLYDTSWTDTVNGNLVALTHVAVLRDGAAPAREPTVLVYKASHGMPNAGAKADFNATAHVNTYQGENGLLYRVFVANGPIQCMDLVLPREQTRQAVNSNLYYQAGATKMVAAFNPKIVK